jgi:thiamine biosynthesis lipoprotein
MGFLTSLLASLSSRAADLPLTTWHGETMASPYVVKIAGASLKPADLDRLKAEVDARLREVNRQMSHYQPDSELSRFNRHEAARPFQVSAEFARVTRFALDLHRRSGGLFDPTLGPLINLWGFGPKGEIHQAPTDEHIRAALQQCGGQRLQVTERDELVKTLPVLQLNLSAVAKGFGVDEVARVLCARGWTNLFVEIGGEVLALGHSPRGDKWRVGIEAPVPDLPPGEFLEGVVALSGLAIATSGDYRKYFEDAQGRRQAHILDPTTGRPVQHKLASVSVVATNCLLADGLATTLFVMGEEQGRKWIEQWPDAAALFIVRQDDGGFKTLASSRFGALTGYTP